METKNFQSWKLEQYWKKLKSRCVTEENQIVEVLIECTEKHYRQTAVML